MEVVLVALIKNYFAIVLMMRVDVEFQYQHNTCVRIPLPYFQLFSLTVKRCNAKKVPPRSRQTRTDEAAAVPGRCPFCCCCCCRPSRAACAHARTYICTFPYMMISTSAGHTLVGGLTIGNHVHVAVDPPVPHYQKNGCQKNRRYEPFPLPQNKQRVCPAKRVWYVTHQKDV